MASLNETPQGERLHIGIFGKRNAGKSKLLNAITGQDAALVSAVKGTTTDPVFKAMELLPIGPVVLIDTPGIDDSGELGSLRTEKTKSILRKTDIAILVVDAMEGFSQEDEGLAKIFAEMDIKYLIVYNKSDLKKGNLADGFYVSAETGENIEALKEEIIKISGAKDELRRMVSDLIEAGDIVVLVVPLDKSAPKGRLILPQQQAIRDILDAGAVSLVTRDTEFSAALAALKKPPALVITDSQAFEKVARETPASVRLTSFSILAARYKGVLESSVCGVKALESIRDGDKILISEGCTHHRQCEDIGTVKIPKWIEEYTGAKPLYEFSSGNGFPEDLSRFKMIVHCGGCMLNMREMRYRYRAAAEANVPITNFGVLISQMKGILKRSTAPCYELNQSC